MLYLRKEPHRKDASLSVSRERLSRYTGYGETQLDDAAKELQSAGLIRVEARRRHDSKRGTIHGALPSRYVFLRPDSDDPVAKVLGRTAQNPELVMDEKEVNLAVVNKVTFFTVPEDFIAMHDQSWSLANLKPKETPIYVSLLWQAALNRSNTVDVVASKLRRIAAIKDPRTLTTALNRLEALGLLAIGDSEEADFTVTLNDPTTGEPVRFIEDAKADPANYRIDGSRRFVLNQWTEEEREKTLLSFLPPYAPTIRQGNGDLKIQCPYHPDKNPSCSVSFHLSCFHCYGCQKAGTYWGVLVQLKGGDGEAAMRQIAARRGQKIRFTDPNRNVEATYQYKDANGGLLRGSETQGQKGLSPAPSWKLRVD